MPTRLLSAATSHASVSCRTLSSCRRQRARKKPGRSSQRLFPPAPRVVKDERIYTGRKKLISIIRATRDAQVLLIVGHNPSLHDVAVRLIASGEPELRERVNERLQRPASLS